MKKSTVLLLLKIVIPLIILLVILIKGRSIVDINYHELKGYIDEIGGTHFILILLLGIICLVPMFFYDVFFIRMLKIKVPSKKLVNYSWSSNVFTNFIGLGGIAGAALRTYFYKKFTSNMGELVKAIAKLTLFNLSGLSILSWLIIFGVFDTPLLISYPFIKIVLIGFGLYLPAVVLFIYLRNKKGSTYMSWKLQSGFLLVSLVEWCFIILLMWSIIRLMGMPISLVEIVPIFVIAACVGNLSMIPGGLGSFDFIFLIGLASSNVSDEQLLIVLALYRISFYIFPWIIGLFVLLWELWVAWDKKWSDIPKWIRMLGKKKVREGG